MTVTDVANTIQTLPDADAGPVPPEQAPDILDAKMDYEALDPTEKGQVDAGTRGRLNQALAALSQVDLVVTGPASVTEPLSLLENMTGGEAAALKNGDYTSFKLLVVISETTPGAGEEQSSIQTALNGALPGAHYDVSIKKEIHLTGDPAHPVEVSLSDLKHPLLLVFPIPEALRAVPGGVQRSFRMLRTHLENGVYTTAVLADLDDDPATYTVASDQFSTYTLAYQDNAQDDAYQIIASAGPGGTISPSGSLSVRKNSSVSFAIQPAAGYYIQDVVVDGVSVGAVSAYTFADIRENHAIAAFFTQAKADVGAGIVGGLGGSARTGDRAEPALWGALLFLAGAALIGTVYALGKKRRI